MTVKVMLHPKSAAKLRDAQHMIDSNVTGFISWDRLIRLMRSEEFRPEEEVEALVILDTGIQFYVRPR